MKRIVMTVGLMVATFGLHLTMTLYAMQFVPVEAQWAVLLWYGSLGAVLVLGLALVGFVGAHVVELRAKNRQLMAGTQVRLVEKPMALPLAVRPRGSLARKDGRDG